MKIDYAERARALVGVRFRPQGRGPEGLDCVGVILSTFDIPGDSARANYQLRGNHFEALKRELQREFRRVTRAQLRPGDAMLLEVAGDQAHLGVRTTTGFVHAHAGLRRVVETPGSPEWPLIAVFRKRSSR